jgi:hypothetical protein
MNDNRASNARLPSARSLSTIYPLPTFLISRCASPPPTSAPLPPRALALALAAKGIGHASCQLDGAPVRSISTTAGRNNQALLANEKRWRESHNAVERRRRDDIDEKISEPATLIPECMLDVGGESLFFKKILGDWCDFFPPLWVEALVGLPCLFPSSILTKPEPKLTLSPRPKRKRQRLFPISRLPRWDHIMSNGLLDPDPLLTPGTPVDAVNGVLNGLNSNANGLSGANSPNCLNGTPTRKGRRAGATAEYAGGGVVFGQWGSKGTSNLQVHGFNLTS